MLNKLITASQCAKYWVMLVVLGLSLEGVALYFQYVLNEWPCVLCIHVRIWVLGFTLVALLTAFVEKTWVVCSVAHGLIALMMIGMFERSWILLGVERGTIFAECSMDSGLPSWFALDKWFPWLFEIKTTCGYTPELLLGVTMAEALLVISGVMTLVASGLMLISIKNRNE